jgi:hypothetical protein
VIISYYENLHKHERELDVRARSVVFQNIVYGGVPEYRVWYSDVSKRYMKSMNLLRRQF